MAKQITETLFVQVGRKRFALETMQKASEAYCKMIDATGVGSSRAPRADIVDASGKIVAHISYNGRVWPGTRQDWQPGIAPLYDNRTEAV